MTKTLAKKPKKPGKKTTVAKKTVRKKIVKATEKTTVGAALNLKQTDEAAPKPKRKRWDVTARDWKRYEKNPCPESRRELLNKYVPLVQNVAVRMSMGFPKSVELNDLVNTGVIGLTEAFKNYDPDRGVKFETYAVPRIRGAILDELRALDWVPRSTRAKSREIDRATVHLENRLGRLPEKKELADHMEISERDLHLAIDDVSSTTILSLDEVVYPEDDNRQVPRIETIGDANGPAILGDLEKDELRSFLVLAIDRLTEQEKLVIALYYFEELTLKEIGEVMSISESRVSQIHTKAVSKLRLMVREKFALTG